MRRFISRACIVVILINCYFVKFFYVFIKTNKRRLMYLNSLIRVFFVFKRFCYCITVMRCTNLDISIRSQERSKGLRFSTHKIYFCYFRAEVYQYVACGTECGVSLMSFRYTVKFDRCFFSLIIENNFLIAV